MKTSDARRMPDSVLFLITIVLVGFGAVMVYSSSAYLHSYDGALNPTPHVLRQHLFRVLIGLVVLGVGMRIDYSVWRRFAAPLLIVAMVLLLITVGWNDHAVRGTRRWLSFRSVNFQPSELMKLALIFYLASFAARREHELSIFKRGMMPQLLVIVSAALLIILQPNYGVAATILVIGMVMLFVEGIRIWYLLPIAAVSLGGFIGLATLLPHARNRLEAFIALFQDPLDLGYQVRQSLIAIGSGGLFGVGLGGGKQKLLFLPEPHTDFIFSIVGEELGFIGAVAVLVLFLLLAQRGLRIALAAPDTFGSLAAFGITVSIFLHGLLHVGVALGILPVTGLPLPFVSYGGSALLVNLLGMGVLLNVSRNVGEREWPSNGHIGARGNIYESRSRRRRNRRTHLPRSRRR
jgi:cell division protein FtsW